MSKHSKTLKNYPDSFEKLAEQLGDLTYDSLAEFLMFLSEKMERDSIADAQRKRVKLANELEETARLLKKASGHITTAWDICEPYMDVNEKCERQ